MINTIQKHAEEVERYRADVKAKYGSLDQLDRIEAMMADIFAMMYVGMVVMPNSDKEFI